MPIIKAHYRIAEGPENTAIGGSSYGGIAALNFAINEPLLASKILIESPALQVGNGVFFRETEHLAQASSRIYIGMGTRKFGKAEVDRFFVAGARALAKNLAAAAIASAIQLRIGAGDRHDDSAWARRLPEALIFLYGTRAGNINPKPPRPSERKKNAIIRKVDGP